MSESELEDQGTEGIITEQILTSLHEQRHAIEELTAFVKGMAVNLEAVRLAQVSVGTVLARLTEMCSRRPVRCAAIIAGVKDPAPGGDGENRTPEDGWPPEEP